MTFPRKLTMADLDSAVEVQSQAFRDDPLWVYLLPDLTRRERELRRSFRAFLRLGIQSGQAYGVGEPLEGIALWQLPNESTVFSPQVGLGFLRLLLSPFVFSFFKAAPIFGQFSRMRKQYASDPHCYLETISVLPSAQGKGYASQLIRPFLAHADEQGVAAYTETITPGNVSLYTYYGFKVMEAFPVPKTDLTLWGFYRPVTPVRG